MVGQTSIPGNSVSGSREVVAPPRPILAIVDRGSFRDYNLQQEASQKIVIAKVAEVMGNGRILLTVNGKTFPVTLDQGVALTKGEVIRVAIRLLDGRPIDISRTSTGPVSRSVSDLTHGNPSRSVVTSLSTGGLAVGNILGKLAHHNGLTIHASSISFFEARRQLSSGLSLKPKDSDVAEKALRSGLAELIASSVSGSGLFYEAHLKEYLMGRRSKQSLLLEYQNIKKALKESDLTLSRVGGNEEGQENSFILNQVASLSKSAFRLIIEGLFQSLVEVDFEYNLASDNEPPGQGNEDLLPWSIRLKFLIEDRGPLELLLNCHVDHLLIKVACVREHVKFFQEHCSDLQGRLGSITSMVCSFRIETFDE